VCCSKISVKLILFLLTWTSFPLAMSPRACYAVETSVTSLILSAIYNSKWQQLNRFSFMDNVYLGLQ
jgi:hypothetical protein